MKPRRKVVFLIILLIVCIAIKLYASYGLHVEQHYSTSLFPYIASAQRYLFGGLPFSLGDIIYGLLVAWLLFKLVRMIIFISRNREAGAMKRKLRSNGYVAAVVICMLYIIFNLFWGINYNRKGIAWQLGLSDKKYEAADLLKINGLLLQKVNSTKQSLLQSNNKYPVRSALFNKVEAAYTQVEKQYPFLSYTNHSIKASMWSIVGNYGGFTGYYNPFTGEAQVNTTVPAFVQPFTACHEVAHQLGYAKEGEANFVGYLAATASSDSLFHYSAYLEMFLYANRNLFFTDSSAAKHFRLQLSEPVTADIKEWILFNRKFTSPAQPMFKILYGWFLRSNEQPQGILSYDEVTGLLIAYYKQQGAM